ncbi:MAG: carbohydrate ABC transporter permease [Chloroflexota bacterium]
MITSRSVVVPRAAVRWFRPSQAIFNLLLLGFCFIVLVPLIWAVSSSLKGSDELYQAIPSLIPYHPTLANYEYMVTKLANFPIYMRNSFVVSFGTVFLVVLLSSLAGYAFARMDFRGRDLIFVLLIMLIFVPRSGGLMALYELMSFLHLRNSLLGLILLFSGGLSTPIFIMRQTYLSVPKEIEEAARIDGASWLQVFWFLAVPLGAAGMVVVAIFTFVAVWGDFLVTLTMIDQDTLLTISVGIQKLLVTVTPFFAGSSFTGKYATYGTDCALLLTSAAPVVIIYIALQRWLVRGLTEGILKL